MSEVPTKTVPIDSISPHPENYNQHPESQIAELVESAESFGQFKNVVVWSPDSEIDLGNGQKLYPDVSYILAGHGFWLASRRAGRDTIEVKDYTGLPYEDALMLMQVDNAAPLGAQPDPNKLKMLLQKTRERVVDRPKLGAMLARLRESAGVSENGESPKDAPDPQVDKAAQLQEKWQVKLGDIWQLNRHRLICGDCTDKAVIEALMNDDKYDSLITDPPFFTPATHYQSRIKHQRKFSDLSTLTGFFELVLNITDEYKKDSSHVVVFCNADSYAVFYPVMFSRFDKTKSLVWDKGHVGLGRIFRHQHELMIWGRNAEHYFAPNGKLYADVMTYEATPSKDREHPVEKPVALLENLIEPLTPEGGIIFDPFLGSGPALIAAELTNRICYGVDMESSYISIVLERWQQMTHQDPVLLSE